MARNPSFPGGVIPKKQAAGPIDIMRPGNGTPWEDRGSIGAVGAYFKTAIKSITSPALLLDHIRRPETPDDATSFAMISIVMWVVGILVWNAWWLYVILPKGQTDYVPRVDPVMYWVSALLQALIVGGGIFAFLKVGPGLYRSLSGNELKLATPSLIYNCFGYSLGPSIFAVVPIFGWGLAGLLIAIDLLVAGKRRLYMKSSSAIVNVIILAVIVLGIGAVLYFVLPLVWGHILGLNGLEVKTDPTAHDIHPG